MKIKNIALLGLFFAVAIVLSIVESLVPTAGILPPGAKLGLSNIIVMYCLFVQGKKYAVSLVVLKAVFAMLTRGVVAGLLSICGGLVSCIVLIILMAIFKDKLTYLMLSVIGAVCHNIGQFIGFSLVFQGSYLYAYFVFLMIFGIISGIISALILKVVMPYLKRCST